MDIKNNQRVELIDWRGKRANSKHGGFKAASLICVVEMLENMVFLANALNLVTYFIKVMHYPNARAANMLTNFIGTSFLLSILGGFISDSFVGNFWTFTASISLQLVGLMVLIIQAQDSKLQPKVNETPSPTQEAILYIGLYTMALGIGGVKASLPAHGGDQLLDHNQDYIEDGEDHEQHEKQQTKQLTTFFNWYFFSLCMGGLLATTSMVWIEDNKGWNWSFKICAAALALALLIFCGGSPFYIYKRPSGSPLTRICKVLLFARKDWRTRDEILNHGANEDEAQSPPKLKFLEKAFSGSKIDKDEVKETKKFLGLLPIFACTILMNCCLAQLQTFTVEQGTMMNRKIFNFTIPTQSINVVSLIIMLSSIPCYEFFAHMFGEEFSKEKNMFHPLRRIGLGLMLASGSMAAAAFVEAKRRQAAHHQVILSVFWLVWQYLLLSVSDMMTLGGMLEFFYSEAPPKMKSMCTSLSWISMAMGYFLSSLLVSISNAISARYGSPWLAGTDLNHSRLDLFYTLLCVINFINFLNYLYWAKRY